MNYKSYATIDDSVTNHQLLGERVYSSYDRGNGVPTMNENNMTLQDIYRTPFLFTQEHHRKYNNMMPAALKGIQSQSELSKLFFSDKNMKRIQKMIKKEVYSRTNGNFKLEIDQDPKDVFIVMRAVYFEYARFIPNQIVRQVKRLNKKVIEEVIPGILTQIRQYYGYQKEINKPLTPMIRPVNVNNKGRLQLPSITTTWGT